MQTIHKCPHYERNCHIQSPCCRLFYPCKLCHDQKFIFKKGCQIDRMTFEKVQLIKCLNCLQEQTPSLNCIKCKIQFGKYACLKCKLYENKQSKVADIFHCDDCKMCRRGTTQSVKHCFTCGYCVPVASQNHKCLENVGDSNCPVCLQILKYSTKRFFGLKCGHLIHVECFQMLKEINCPTCGMAIRNLSAEENKHIENQIEKTKANLPPQLAQTKVNILCSECLHKTINAPFHYFGIKCEKCGTYNTKMI